MVPRALAPYHQPISSLTLHAFGDASAKGVSAAVYAIVHQDQGVTQQLVCAKSGLAKKNLTIPRLELVAGHMAVNLVTNVQAALRLNRSALLDQGSRVASTVEPPVQRQASLRMPRKNYRGISNLPLRRPPLHSQVGLQCSLSYST